MDELLLGLLQQINGRQLAALRECDGDVGYGETGGDLYDADDADCAPEGTSQPATTTADINAAVLASLTRIERALSAIASTLTGVALLTEVLDRKYDEKYMELRRAHTDLSYRVPV